MIELSSAVLLEFPHQVMAFQDIIFTGVDEGKERRLDLMKHYKTKYGEEPLFFVKCPGRINLIGEHIDYNGFGVLPIAIEKHILVAVGANDKVINIANVEGEKYPEFAIPFAKIPSEIDRGNISWHDYIIAGVLRIAEKYKLHDTSFNMLVSGNLPPASGLSSSSALVCAAAIAVVYKYHLHDRYDVRLESLARECAEAEYYVGTRGGGMDQAIIFLAAQGYATKIEFHPLRHAHVCLPAELSFIVAISGVKKEKAKSNHFNKRVAECKLALKLLAKKGGLEWTDVNTLNELATCLKRSPDQMLEFLHETLQEGPYSSAFICDELEISFEELKELLSVFHLENLETEEFELLQRARHVFIEVNNVNKFINAGKSEDLATVGKTMLSSHESLRYNYDCSHPKLDDLVDKAVQFGALGARLTGAGWGGAIIAAVVKDREQDVEKALRNWVIENGGSADDVFSTIPRRGACVIK